MDLRVGGKFKLIKKCGSGAFGEIYQGKCEKALHSRKSARIQRRKMNHFLTVSYFVCLVGSNVKTGDDVAIKLVSREDAIQFIPAIGQ
jgi:hypothetical protein